MKASWVALLVAGVAFAGCSDNANPSLAAPKLVLAPRDDGTVEAFLHAAFGERLYERLTLAVDNVTLVTEEDVFSLERTITNASFYFEASALTDREEYVVRGHASFLPDEEQFEVAFHGPDGDWSAPQDFGAPFERVLSRREVTSA